MDEGSSSSDLIIECNICFESKSLNDISFLPCIHFLCNNCYSKLKKNECPYCRNKIEEEHSDFEDAENEYSDVNFEVLIVEHENNRRKRKKKKAEKKLLRSLNNSEGEWILASNNSFRMLTPS